MNALVKHISIASAFALLAVGSAGAASAQSNENEGRRNFCAENPDICASKMDRRDDSDESNSRKRRFDNDEDRADRDDGDKPRRMKQAQSDWKYDSKRHKRRRSKDDEFRFYFGGFWYPEPYWSGYGFHQPYRIGCAEGRSIVRDRGFYRVRTLECQGRTFTYIGRRHGDTFRVVLNSRTGRILDIDRI
jgi:hypothetical protein